MTTATLSRLSAAPVSAILPIVDVSRARSFYHDTLGLEVSDVVGSEGYLTVSAGGGTTFMLYERAATSADHTVAGFSVDDLSSVVSELRSRGVVFDEYDLPGLKTVDGIATMGSSKSAWFHDSEGNILSINEMH